MRKRKVMALLLVATLTMLTLLTGCKDTNVQSSKQAEKESADTSETASGNKGENTETSSKINATGTVYDLGGLSLPICEPGSVTLTYMGNDTWCSGVSFKDGLPVQNEIEARTGVHINWDVYSSDIETVLQTRLASSGDLPDIVEIPPFNSNIGVDTYSNNGVLVPLNDLIEQNAPNIKALFAKYPALEAMCTSADGNIYGLAGWWGDINDYVPDYLYIRQDWLNALGLEMPKTPEELYNVLKAFKTKDPNGNGEADEIPLATKNGITQLYYLMTGFGFNTNSLWYVDETGKVQFAPLQDKYKDMLVWLNKCYSEGLISSDIDGTMLTQNITENKVGIVCHDPVDNMAASDDLVLATDPNCDYEIMDILQTSADSSDAVLTKRSLTWHYYGITSACENPEAAIKWIDYVYASEDGRMLYNYGVEGLTYEKDASGNISFTDYVTNNKTYTSAFLALRSVGAWPTYLINDSGEAFLKIFEGTKVEKTCEKYYGNMKDPFPEMLGTSDESEVYTNIWPDMQTYLDEEFTAFVVGTQPLEDFDKYVETAESMGIDDVIDIKAAQYERYQKLTGK